MPIVMQEEESGEEDAAASGPVASQRNEQPARRRLKRAGEGVGRPHQRWPAEKNAGNRGRTTANRSETPVEFLSLLILEGDNNRKRTGWQSKGA